MAWQQVFCPECGHHMSHMAIIKYVGGDSTGRSRKTPLGKIYRCPKCSHEFGVRNVDPAINRAPWKK